MMMMGKGGRKEGRGEKVCLGVYIRVQYSTIQVHVEYNKHVRIYIGLKTRIEDKFFFKTIMFSSFFLY